MDAPTFQKISLDTLEYKRCNSPMEPPCRFFASVNAAENKPFYFLHAVYEGMIAGGAAGVIAEAVLYPIDTIKTRLQARRRTFQTVACELRLYMTVDVQKNSIESKEKT
uniref:Uncharacterized protein n=1 Tax=Salix viminalis TaxID=40686 RepID=A0A6N2KTM8_SALVM